MTLMGILNIFYISPSLTTLYFYVGRRYLQRLDSQISEHTQLLQGQSTSVVVEVQTSDLLRAKNVQPTKIEEQVITLRKNPEVRIMWFQCSFMSTLVLIICFHRSAYQFCEIIEYIIHTLLLSQSMQSLYICSL